MIAKCFGRSAKMFCSILAYFAKFRVCPGAETRGTEGIVSPSNLVEGMEVLLSPLQYEENVIANCHSKR